MEQNKKYKRQTRTMSDHQKALISAKLRGRPKSYTHRMHISDGLKRMWQSIPSKDNSNATNSNHGN